jgi:hypothetical protein
LYCFACKIPSSEKSVRPCHPGEVAQIGFSGLTCALDLVLRWNMLDVLAAEQDVVELMLTPDIVTADGAIVNSVNEMEVVQANVPGANSELVRELVEGCALDAQDWVMLDGRWSRTRGRVQGAV